VVERREYRNPDGSFVASKKGKHQKTFRQRRPDPKRQGEWVWNVNGIPALPYRLPELIEAIACEHPIIVVEGEAKANLLLGWNVPATCCAMGAGKWKAEHAEYLRDADVVILPDNDIAGAKHVDKVATSLQGIAAAVRVLRLPDLPEGGDIVDWADAGGTVEALHDLIAREAKPWVAVEDAEPVLSPEHSDDAIALQFADHHANDLRFIDHRSRWMFWESCLWVADETLRAFDCVRMICRQVAAQCDIARTATQLASARTVAAVERLAKADRRIAAATDQFDADPEIFNEEGP
jgi:DNA primase